MNRVNTEIKTFTTKLKNQTELFSKQFSFTRAERAIQYQPWTSSMYMNCVKYTTNIRQHLSAARLDASAALKNANEASNEKKQRPCKNTQ